MVVAELGVPVGAQRSSSRFGVRRPGRRGAGAAAWASPPTAGRRGPAATVVRGGRRQPGGHGVEEPVALGLRVGSAAAEAGPAPARPVRARGGPVRRRSGPADREVHRSACGRRSGAAPPRTAGRARPRSSSQRPARTVAPSSWTPSGELGGQAGLPHPRFAGQEGDAPLPRHRLLPQLAEPLQLGVPADEDATELGQQRAASGSTTRRAGSHSTRTATTGSGRPFSSSGPTGAEPVGVARAGQDPDHLRSEDLPAAGRGAQARRLDHRRAVHVVVLEGTSPAREADPHRQRQRRLPRSVEPVDGLLDRHRRSHRIRRPGEGGHDPVAEALDHPAGVRLDRLGQQPVVGAAQLLGRLAPRAGPAVRWTQRGR